MPELPEVETIRTGLSARICGATIADLQLQRKNLRYDFPENFRQQVLNTSILTIKRRAKYLLFNLSNGYSIISHLGMSGSWLLRESLATLQKHDHAVLTLQLNDSAKKPALIYLVYNDPRRFGFIFCEPSLGLEQHKCLKNLGIEPLTSDLNAMNLYKKIAHRKISFKAALLDQSIIAGLGNIYVCEALWRSQISPLENVYIFCAKTKNLQEKLAQLCYNIQNILHEALQAGGSSLRDYKNAMGEAGAFQNNFAVYNRASLPCLRCGLTIVRMVQNGRSSFYCATCQPLPTPATCQPRSTNDEKEI